MALNQTFTDAPIISIIVKDLLDDVAVSANALLQTKDNWFTEQGKTLNGLVGVNPFVVEYFRNNPDKYPNVVTLQPFYEKKGPGNTLVTIPKIVIVTDYDEEDNLTDRSNLTVKPVLFPAYEAFLQMLVQHQYVIDSDWLALDHTISVIPGWQPADSQLQQYLDAIEIINLQFSIFSPLNC